MNKVSKINANLSLGCTGLGLFILALLHILKPDVSIFWNFISEYSLGEYGILMNVVFLSFTVSLVTFGVSLFSHAKKVPGKIGLVLVFISSVGMLLGAIFNTDPAGTTYQQMSTEGFMHSLGGQLNMTPFAALFLTVSLVRLEVWKSFKLILIVLTILVFVFVGAFIITAAGANGVFGPGSITALFGRFMLLVYFIWQVIALQPVRRLP